ncbi:MAG: hypothetical protein UY23_C0005G0056 [Candidatus Jorgensenbacteria bacterium GW2011_GWA1_48_11]|uniref:Zinc-binding domain-containing protein n=1 Tax=Candidatus Jorgensenbacteria bacterium GW2011_GWA1_48_11 TaxID=1618660 RepID=A0A0G1X9C8_9BACT|nr:MAG: hypothetical protein UY23_C0005G0056 [Candidatus Jorgensenbacteria bacterium GW2011_GWA1_48_11]KKW12309.1 MAG: hypothetical protein UY51_C0005G0551 [Candidatus Jorgensenbacteria bacterium GW2011_GWB1_49_9]
MANAETIICQNCKTSFEIEASDFQFYERIKVPPPTWCPECRMKRRMLFRNEFNMHKSKCAFCGKETLSHHSSKVMFPVYCNECWWSDKWDPMEYSRDYNPNKNFFVQWKELSDTVPRPSLEAYQNENSPYSDYTWFSKNVYLSPSTISSDNVSYSKSAWNCRDAFDSMVVMGSESIYEALDSEHCVNCKFISDCKDCLDGSYLFDCRNSSNCFMSSNLRNKKFVFRNEQLTEEEYRKRMSAMDRGYKIQIELYSEYVRLRENALHKYANMVKCTNSSGSNLTYCKNAKYCFNSHNCEDVKYGAQMSRAKDVQDMYGVGDKESSLLYEGVNVGYLDSNIFFSTNTFENCARLQYCDYCRVSQDLFGCIGLRNKRYCILNKQYDKDEYESLQERIIKGMSDKPHIDLKGNVYKYGEFFPVEFSPFAYNEALTQFYFPIKRDDAIRLGYGWMESAAREHQVTLKAEEIPNSIEEIKDEILDQVIGCGHKQECGHNCTLAFKITPQELQFYRKTEIPIPRLCAGCRRGERRALYNPIKLWHRQCMCDYKVYENSIKHQHHLDSRCLNEFETSYSLERKEVVYCEACYNAEVV